MPAMRIELILRNVDAKVMICDCNTVKAVSELNFFGDIVLYDEICQTAVDEGAIRKIHEETIDTDLIYVVLRPAPLGSRKG